MSAYFQNTDLQRLVTDAEVIIFDMNGLIVDDEPIQLDAVNTVLAPYHLELTDHQWATQCVGRKPIEFFTELLAKENLTAKDFEQLCLQKEDAYESLIRDRLTQTVREGFLEFVDYLLAEKKRLAVATSTSRPGMEVILGKNGIGLLEKLDFVICGNEVTQSKPNPMIYQKVIKHFGESRRYLVFEDSQAGVTAAKDAGLPCIAVPHRFSQFQDLSRADLRITNFTKNAERLG